MDEHLAAKKKAKWRQDKEAGKLICKRAWLNGSDMYHEHISV